MKRLIILFSIISVVPAALGLTPVKAQTFDCSAVTDVPKKECEALVALYNSTQGEYWFNKQNWLQTFAVGNWYGVRVENGHVTGIWLNYNNPRGQIPSQIGDLSELSILHLSVNYLKGPLPNEIGNLTKLVQFWIYNNLLTGHIPESLIALTNIQLEYGLDFDWNYLNVPPNYPDTSNPFHLYLVQRDSDWHERQQVPFTTCSSVVDVPASECQALAAFYTSTGGQNWVNNDYWLFSTMVGDWYGVTVENGHVTMLEFSYNNLSGSLPPEIGNLTSLKRIYLYSNPNLGGSIPSTIGQLSNLEELKIVYSSLSGTLPDSIFSLNNLKTLNLCGNQLSGTLPKDLQRLSNLVELDLSYNQFTGTIPREWGNLTNLEILGLGGNQLSGSIPAELSNLKKLHSIWLGDNSFTGTFPLWITELPNLMVLDLEVNDFHGNLPAELGNLTNLYWLYLGGNRFTGSIPKELGQLSNLNKLDLYHNELTGSIPPELGNLTNLQELNLDSNHLTGNIPPQLGNLTNLQKLDLGSNHLTGNIPPEIGNLVNLERLWLFGNELTGSIPKELGNLNRLGTLWLSHNQLSGSIPSELGNLTNLMLLSLYDNQLSGDVPVELMNLSNVVIGLSFNRLNVPENYPDPNNPFHQFLYDKDPYWHLYQPKSQLISEQGGVFTSRDEGVAVKVQSLTEPALFFFTPLLNPSKSFGMMNGGIYFTLTAASQSTGQPLREFQTPLEIKIRYDEDYLKSSSIPEGNIGLYYWDEEASAWKDAATTCGEGKTYQRNLEENWFSVEVCHFTEFGVFAPNQIFLPLVRR